MTKVLLVSGDEAYSALTFESAGLNVSEVFEETLEAGGTQVIEIDGQEIILRTYVFGDVDPAFILFIKNHIQDYDESKSTEFYIVKG